MKRTIGEILDRVFSVDSVLQRIEVLKTNECKPLKKFLKYALDPTIKFAIPDGVPPYKKSGQKAGFSSSNLASEIELCYRYVMPHPTERYHPTFWGPEKKRVMKREQFFVGTLETLDNREAVYFIQMKSKVLHEIGNESNILSADDVNLAFPGLIPSASPQSKDDIKIAKAVEKIEPIAKELVEKTKTAVKSPPPHPVANGVKGSISKKIKEAARERRKYLADKEKDKAKRREKQAAKRAAKRAAKKASEKGESEVPLLARVLAADTTPIPDYGTKSALEEIVEDYSDVTPADPAFDIDPSEFLIRGK